MMRQDIGPLDGIGQFPCRIPRPQNCVIVLPLRMSIIPDSSHRMDDYLCQTNWHILSNDITHSTGLLSHLDLELPGLFFLFFYLSIYLFLRCNEVVCRLFCLIKPIVSYLSYDQNQCPLFSSPIFPFALHLLFFVAHLYRSPLLKNTDKIFQN